MIIDTHSHLYLDNFDDDREAIIQNARDIGVTIILLPAIDSGHHRDLLDLYQSDTSFFRPMMGVHPCSIQPENWKEELAAAEKLLDNGTPYCAVGEIGIDLYWDKSTLDIQREAFKTQIRWAKERNLPIVIHCREGFDEIFEVIDSENDKTLRGVFHCFTGTIAQAERIIGFGGFLLGIGGVLTFKNSGLDLVIEEVDLQHLALETDAPYLAPVPHRGKRNESAFVNLVLKKLADIKGMPESKVAEITSNNAKQMFQI